MGDIWQRSLRALRKSLPADHFADLTASVRVRELDTARVCLEVPGRIQRDWIIEHYVELLASQLQAAAGHPVKVEVEVVPRRRRRRTRSRAATKPDGITSDGRTGRRSPVPTPGPLSGQRRIEPIAACKPSAAPPAPAPAQQYPLQQLLQVAGPAPPSTGLSKSTPAPALAAGEERLLPPADPLALRRLLNERYTFDTFVVGSSNQMAHAAATGTAAAAGKLYNPLFLYGGSGLGKTHLLQAVGHRVLVDAPGLRVVYRSAEDFMNDFTRSLRLQRMEVFRSFYREQCDVLLLDDVQFMSRKEQTQQEFFHTFEALFRRGRQIVMTSDRLPREIDHLDDRLCSRFTWGLLADIQSPALETRVAIVQKKAEVDGLSLRDDVALFVAESFRTNVRELEGALTRLAAYASFAGRAVTLAFAREVLGEHVPAGPGHTIEDTIKAVADHYGLRVTDIRSKRRHRAVARPRQVAMFLARTLLDHSFPEIGRAFERDHSTVMSACRRIKSLMRTDSDLANQVKALRLRLQDG